MTDLRSWKFWVILALGLMTLACANREERRERREQAREDRRARADERYQARMERERQRREARASSRDRRVEEDEGDAPAASPPPRRQTAQRQAPPPAAADSEAKVVFMRVSKQTSGVDAALFDVTEPGEPKFIGNVGAGTKLAYPVKPGLYTFMAVGDTAEFMQATIVEGRTYYALVVPRSGAKRFTIEPIRKDELAGKDFQTWDRGTKTMPAGAGRANTADAAEKRGRYWDEFVRKPQAQRAELTLNAEDGR